MGMDNLQQLQNIWQGHQPEKDFDFDTNKISESILDKIKKTEQKVLRINVAKTIIISILILNFIWIFNQLNLSTIFTWLGVGFITISSMVTMIIYWRIQFRSSNLNHNLPQNKFVEDAIYQMKNQKNQFVKLFRWFVLFIIIGINLFYFDLLEDINLNLRLIYHFSITVFMVIMFLLGLKFREKKFKREFQPLIDELESTKE